MAALKLDMTVPLGSSGHAQIIIDVRDVGALGDADRAFLADTCAEFCAFAGRVLAPPGAAESAPQLAQPAVHDPDASVLNGVRGSRIRADL